MKLIDKDAVSAEIENLLDKGKYHEEYDCAYRDGNNGALYALKGRINTLEVKEVDLEKEIECSLPKPAWGWNEDYLGKSEPAYSIEQMKEFAKHFFELGMSVSNKAQKGE